MKLISLGKFDKKIFIILLTYVIFALIFSLMNHFYFNKLQNKSVKLNISLSIIIKKSFCVFFSIPEYLIRKRDKIKIKEYNKKEDNKILYIFTKPKQMNFKGFPFLCLCFLFYLAFNYYFQNIYLSFHYERIFLYFNNEGYSSIILIFFFLLSKIIDKNIFYRHHYAPMVIIILMGIMRYIMNLNRLNYEFIFPDDLIIFLILLLNTLSESIFYFMKERYDIFLLFLYPL